MKIHTSKTEFLESEVKRLMALVERVVAEEREACAVTAENTSVYDRYSPEDTIADAIRARKQQPTQIPPNCGTGYCSCIECFKLVK
jgi:hypothetical protein